MSKAKAARTLISMPPDFLDDVDALAEAEQRSRSELIREALRQYMKQSDVVLDRRGE